MKSSHYAAVMYGGHAYCLCCVPTYEDDENIVPIFASDEVTEYPACVRCGMVHKYMRQPIRPIQKGNADAIQADF